MDVNLLWGSLYTTYNVVYLKDTMLYFQYISTKEEKKWNRKNICKIYLSSWKLNYMTFKKFLKHVRKNICCLATELCLTLLQPHGQ